MIMNEKQKLKIGNSKTGNSKTLRSAVSQFDYVRVENLDKVGILFKNQVYTRIKC